MSASCPPLACRRVATDLTPELITSTWEPGDVSLSPDGSWAVWVAAPHGKTGEHPESGVWVAPVDGSLPARRLTRGGADTHPRFSPDGTRIAFLSDRAERGTAGLYVIDPAGGEALPLAVRKRSVEALAWAPDSSTVAFLAPGEPDAEDERREKERDDPDVFGERWQLNRVLTCEVGQGPGGGGTGAESTGGGGPADSRARVVWSGPMHPTALAFSPDGTRIAVVARPTPELDRGARAAIHLLTLPTGDTSSSRDTAPDETTAPDESTPDAAAASDAGAGPVGDLVRVAGTPWADQLAWTADGRRLVVTGKHTVSLQSAATVWAVDALPGAEPTVLGPGIEEPLCALDVRTVGGGAPAPVVVSVADGIETRLEWRDTGGDTTTLWEPSGEVLGFDVAMTADGPVIAALAHLESGPLEVWAGRPGSVRQLSDHHAAWADIAFGEVRELVTRTTDGLTLHSVVVLPVDAGPGPHPTVVLPHGGPYWRMARNLHCAWHDWSQLLAVAGYAVVLPNFRGGSGHGNAFATSVNGNPAVEFDDVEAVIASAVEEGITDPERLGVGGWSNGGFLTAWAVVASRRFRAAVMGAGVSHWPAMSVTSDVPTFTGDVAGGSPWSAEPGRSVLDSPLTHAAEVRTPVLMLHGAEDVRVPPSQSVGLLRALRDSDVPVELVFYPREPHSIGEARHQQDLMRRVLDWYRTHLPLTPAAPVTPS